jgi:hypothetical protein
MGYAEAQPSPNLTSLPQLQVLACQVLQWQ